MNGVLLDTNIVIDFLRSFRGSRPKSDEHKFHSEKSIELLEELIETRIPRYLSCHTIKELLQYPNISAEEEDRIYNILPQFLKILPTTKKVARVSGILSRQSAEYRDYHIEDCYIAATAIANELPLYTRNPVDFRYVQHDQLRIVIPYQYGQATAD